MEQKTIVKSNLAPTRTGAFNICHVVENNPITQNMGDVKWKC